MPKRPTFSLGMPISIMAVRKRWFTFLRAFLRSEAVRCSRGQRASGFARATCCSNEHENRAVLCMTHNRLQLLRGGSAVSSSRVLGLPAFRSMHGRLTHSGLGHALSS